MYISYLLAKTIQNDHLREASQDRLARKFLRLHKKMQTAKKTGR